MEALDTALLRDRGLRATRPRLAVVATLRRLPHASAEEIARDVRTSLDSVSTQAIYDVLNALTDAALVRRVDPTGARSARYELDLGDNHHHLVCRRCGLIVDVPCAVGHTVCLQPAIDHGFALAESEVTYWGLCSRCQHHAPEPTPAAASPLQEGTV
ncbi:Fur family transcriptional regulator [Litorihabitans aurantiacus]|uniref:Transcriptional repressor n=1 Tax=Litorihabitans aurantiacus TaxID=1930061 RepID=A0AA37XGD3_9MICO|nr:Fur family transcriptional regulator [Litorihabitans aurantiacus]GMA32629.1 transcriptional repressor [Litorihabitans aurantiacus]